MKKNESSLTSLISAFGRAYHSKYDDNPKIFDDFIAKDLITEEEFTDIRENMTNGISFFNQEIAKKYQDHPDEILKWITQVQLSPTPLARSAYCEYVLLKEITLGVKQYVILGAGLDSFCFRHPELGDSLDIIEVDYPATQDFKKKRLANANYQIPDNLHFVSMDFTKEVSKLIEENLMPNKKTFFSLLGVTYYLSKEEIANLINKLFAEVPSRSSIVFDYADDNLFEEKGLSNRVENMIQMASASGEPMKSCFTFSEMEKMLESASLLIYEHSSPATIHDQFFQNRTDYLSAFETIHYIHAVKK
ncbi:class I SAM-dependent methyltransferase [Gracilibacillus caseinilyticus]|uniref:S-adenosyl-L-methionine-dependent methyltransferase n=1 Tax=Gracilibacillus caseinilyticus TaxID=2932256 RepID=A0ABY4F3D0_9BACI|nr:class I SAM-dependent methyltransferase [Gracilibacillus caseinilyticus]UOQ48956.1 class I SAM-dependent methyltransferase [Gracilibacillus caseinilyticus]